MAERVEVYAGNRMTAQVICSALQGDGIDARLFSEGYNAAYPLTVGAIGEGRISVPETDRDRALEIIRAVDSEAEASEADPGEARSRLHPAYYWVAFAILVISLVSWVISGFPTTP